MNGVNVLIGAGVGLGVMLLIFLFALVCALVERRFRGGGLMVAFSVIAVAAGALVGGQMR